jgi:hypothetical protein
MLSNPGIQRTLLEANLTWEPFTGYTWYSLEGCRYGH